MRRACAGQSEESRGHVILGEMKSGSDASLQRAAQQLRWIFPQLRCTIPMIKSYLLPFPSDFFRGYNGKCGFSTVTMEIPRIFWLYEKKEGSFLDQVLKKQVLRTFTYGLYAVSCANEDEVNMFTANWLTQVSFDPPLLAVSVENASKSLLMILNSRKFTVNVLRSGERELAGKLGKSAIKHPDKLTDVGFDAGANGCPILHNALAWVACEVHHTAEAGDSTLIVAEVVDTGMPGEGQALTMAEAGFRHAG